MNVWFCEDFTANFTGGIYAVPRPNSRLRGVQIDEVLPTEHFLLVGEYHTHIQNGEKMNFRDDFLPEHYGLRVFVFAVSAIIYVVAIVFSCIAADSKPQLSVVLLTLGITSLQAGASNLKITTRPKIIIGAVLTLLPAAIALLGV
ncbi:hypothetical protein [Enterobacter hormaechei]|uniref:hypothetical protein n=2 Tax=Enterobacter TaxID=547 RepID=UPI00292DACD8|nr:hypothetical protein [Enterobacter hormaechei]WNZ53520.1 hypothetical protein O0R42_10040 [Enterobacter hormaechei subsp. xiangfangensis]